MGWVLDSVLGRVLTKTPSFATFLLFLGVLRDPLLLPSMASRCRLDAAAAGAMRLFARPEASRAGAALRPGLH